MSCQKSFQDHFDDVVVAFRRCAAGGGCEDTYKALVELAGTLQILHGWETHVPGEPARLLAAKARAAQEAELRAMDSQGNA